MGDTISDIFDSEPKVDKEAQRAAEAERARLAKEKAELDAKEKEEEEAKKRGLRGRRALSAGPLTGYGQPTLLSKA